MTKLVALLTALAVIVMTLPAMACSFHDQQTVQSTPVITSDATPQQTPVPPKTDKTKTGS